MIYRKKINTCTKSIQSLIKTYPSSPPFAYRYFNYYKLFVLRNKNSKIIGNLPMANMFGLLVLINFICISFHVIFIAHRRNLNLLHLLIPTSVLFVGSNICADPAKFKSGISSQSLSSKSISISINLMYFLNCLPRLSVSCLVYLCRQGHVWRMWRVLSGGSNHYVSFTVTTL